MICDIEKEIIINNDTSKKWAKGLSRGQMTYDAINLNGFLSSNICLGRYGVFLDHWYILPVV